MDPSGPACTGFSWRLDGCFDLTTNQSLYDNLDRSADVVRVDAVCSAGLENDVVTDR